MPGGLACLDSFQVRQRVLGRGRFGGVFSPSTQTDSVRDFEETEVSGELVSEDFGVNVLLSLSRETTCLAGLWKTRASEPLAFLRQAQSALAWQLAAAGLWRRAACCWSGVAAPESHGE